LPLSVSGGLVPIGFPICYILKSLYFNANYRSFFSPTSKEKGETLTELAHGFVIGSKMSLLGPGTFYSGDVIIVDSKTLLRVRLAL